MSQEEQQRRDSCGWIPGRQGSRAPKEMSLYVVTEGDSDQPCKIGSAVDVGKRLCTLNCGNHRQLVLRSQHAIPWLPEEKWLAYQGRVQGIERRIHGRLGHAKLRGEWFYVHFDAAADLIVLELA